MNTANISLIKEGTLRDQLECKDWAQLEEITITGNINQDDINLLNGLAHYNLHSINIKDTEICKLEESSFANCHNLDHIEMPQSLNQIPDDTFVHCISLKEIIIPESCEVIGDFTFSGCKSLSEICIPSNTRLIGASAFKNCSSLNIIRCKSKNPPICYKDTFSDLAEDCKIIVNRDMAPNYQNDEIWRNLIITEQLDS